MSSASSSEMSQLNKDKSSRKTILKRDKNGIHVDSTYLRHLLCNNTSTNTKGGQRWSLRYVSTMVSIEKARNFIPQGDSRFIVCLYISRGWGNVRVKFLDIYANFQDEEELGKLLFQHFTYKLPSNELMEDRDNANRYINNEGNGVFSICIAEHHAYIIYGKAQSEEEHYDNSFNGLHSFIYRPEKQNV